MFIVLLNASKIDLIPLSLHTLLGHHRVPVEFLASLASRNHDRLSIHYFLINYHVVKLYGHLSSSLEANICYVTTNHACHIVHHLLGYRSASCYWKHLIDGSLHWVNKRDLLGKGNVSRTIVGYHELCLHTERSTQGSHWHLKHKLAIEGIRISFYQFFIYIPCHIQCRRSWFLFYAEHQWLIGN